MIYSFISDKLRLYANAIVLDCHSFNDSTKLNQPDIWLGIEKDNVPEHLLERIKDVCTLNNLTLSIKYVPEISISDYYSGNINSECRLQIAVNQKLYMKGTVIYETKVHRLNMLISEMFRDI